MSLPEAHDVQAEALQKYLASVYLAGYLQAALEPFVEELVGKAQQQLENRFDDLLKLMAHLDK